MNDDFSITGYSTLLDAVEQHGFAIRPVCDAFSAEGLVMLLRHDVDLSLSLALRMAQLERDRGIASTYYILPHNDYYNPLSLNGRRELRALAELGHEIGLHCDGALYSSDLRLFEAAVRKDIAVIEDITGRPVRSASQHSPIDSRPMDLARLVEIDPYSSAVMAKYAYASDSNMSWRTRPADLLDRRGSFQLLVHPVWWMADGRTMREKLGQLKSEAVGCVVRTFDETLVHLERCLAERAALDAGHERRRREFTAPPTGLQDR